MKPNKLHVFDFDGTLFRNPLDTPENRAKYEKATGLPWLIDKKLSRELTSKHRKFIGMRSGWYGRPETLEPPLVPKPAPAEWYIQSTCEALKASKADPSVITILLTGRHGGLKRQVLRICDEGGLVEVSSRKSHDGEVFYNVIDPNIQCFFLGDNGPEPKGKKPSETFPWKVWILEQFMELNPEILIVDIWEDRDEHVEKFSELCGLLAPEVNVHHVK